MDRPDESEHLMTQVSSARRTKRSTDGWLPNQHGAWAMLTVPLVVGILRAGPAWVHLVLMVFWFLGYFAFFAVGQWLHTRPGSPRRARLRTPVLSYAATSAVAGGLLALARPGLLWWLPVFVPLAAVSLWYSYRRADRALTNDALTILAACLIGLVAFHAKVNVGPFQAGTGAVAADWTRLGWVTVALFGYFFGTSLYVKTVIRERTNRAYHRASVLYHATVTMFWLVVAIWPGPPRPVAELAIWLVGFFAVTTVRAGVLAGRRVRPMRVGLGELAASVTLATILVLW